jgi:hypothetical protein
MISWAFSFLVAGVPNNVPTCSRVCPSWEFKLIDWREGRQGRQVFYVALFGRLAALAAKAVPLGPDKIPGGNQILLRRNKTPTSS